MNVQITSQRARNFVNGAWIDETPNGIVSSTDPANGDTLGESIAGAASIAGRAAEAAATAFETTAWAQSPRLRAKILYEAANRLEAMAGPLAELLTRENGKILAQSRHEITAGVSELRYYAGLARNVFGRTTETAPGMVSILAREPAGVVAVIVPWNAPVTLLVRSVAPALAAGCTVVIKPAPQTPLVHEQVVTCLVGQDDLPAGVVNSVNEHGIEVGQTLATHPAVDVISFTGSSRTGKLMQELAAPTLKRLSLELGGKAPAVVFPDADLDKAVAEIRRASIVITGQMCTAVSRVLVHKDIEKEMTDRLVAALETVRIGHGLGDGVEMGPLIDHASQERLLGLIERADREAYMVLRGDAADGDLADGAFITPTVFAIDDVSSPLVQEEHFGPVLSLETFTDEKDAVAKSNATRYGLAASVYSNDLHRAMRVSRALKFGSVWLNCHNRLLAEAETGGYRESGVGRLHGVEGLNDFLETKHVFYDAGVV